MTQVEAGDHYRHCNSIAFFTPGAYKLDIVCSLLPSGSDAPLTTTIPAAYDPATGTHCRHVWKFVPPVEVMVKES
jgi:hypothetical protein